MVDGRFILREDKKNKTLRIYDIKTKKYLDMQKKEDIKFLVDLLNDYYCIVYDKWML